MECDAGYTTGGGVTCLDTGTGVLYRPVTLEVSYFVSMRICIFYRKYANGLIGQERQGSPTTYFDVTECKYRYLVHDYPCSMLAKNVSTTSLLRNIAELLTRNLWKSNLLAKLY